MDSTINEQIEILKRGTSDIFSVEELADKLLQAQRQSRQLRIKLGLDPTSCDIHLGHTVVLRKMRQFQDLGHRAVLIIGDYTARIGDPSGQVSTRPVLSDTQIEANARTYFEQAGKILDTSAERLETRYNSQWLAGMTLADVIRLAGSMTVARMLERDTFEQRHRKGQPVGIHELLYPLMQGWDSVTINSDVELGGTDQTFNNLVGRDLQRSAGKAPQVVITMPILVGLDGVEKMSKSKGNYVGVNDPPDDMFGKLMSISDSMMGEYYRLLTPFAKETIDELTDPRQTHPRDAKIRLARTIVEQMYDEKTASAARARFEKVFARGELPEDMPVVSIGPGGITAAKLLLRCKMVSSGGEAKRIIRQNGASIDGARIDDPNARIIPVGGMVVQVGKRKFARLEVER